MWGKVLPYKTRTLWHQLLTVILVFPTNAFEHFPLALTIGICSLIALFRIFHISKALPLGYRQRSQKKNCLWGQWWVADLSWSASEDLISLSVFYAVMCRHEICKERKHPISISQSHFPVLHSCYSQGVSRCSNQQNQDPKLQRPLTGWGTFCLADVTLIILGHDLWLGSQQALVICISYFSLCSALDSLFGWVTGWFPTFVNTHGLWVIEVQTSFCSHFGKHMLDAHYLKGRKDSFRRQTLNLYISALTLQLLLTFIPSCLYE